MLTRLRNGLASAGGLLAHPPLYLLASVVIILLVALAAGATAFLHPALPRVIVMATGAEGGAYAEFGEQYRRIFAQQGVRLTVLRSNGSDDNLALLRHQRSGVAIALVQSGLTTPQQSPDLVSLGTVSVEPFWIFCRQERSSPARLDRLRGRRVSVGPVGSGMRSLALALLARNGVDERNTALLPFTAGEAAARLVAGDIDAALIVAAADAPAVRQLLAAPEIRLMPLSRADTYVALFPYLSRVVLPAGFADLARDRPAEDVPMVAVKTSLVVRRDLPSAVQYLLLEAATRIHGAPGVFQKAGEFPAAEATDLPLSDVARQFYKSGSPLLQRHLPLWLAILVEQLAITLIPVAAVAYPLLRTLPSVYAWGMRRRIYRLYGELKLLEHALEDRDRKRRAAALSELARLAHRAAHLRVPTSFAPLLYALRQDVDLVRASLEKPRLERAPIEVARHRPREMLPEPALGGSTAGPPRPARVIPPPG